MVYNNKSMHAILTWNFQFISNFKKQWKANSLVFSTVGEYDLRKLKIEC